MLLIKVCLHNLLFFARHGIHEEETLVGGEFEVNAELSYEEPAAGIKKINDTVDYTAVYQIIRDRMQKATPLLETLAMEIAAEIKKTFFVTKEINIRIKKNNPPVTGINGNVEVVYKKTYS